MKIIITGTTGYIGEFTLKHALADPRITSVVALVRKPLSSKYDSQPKLDVQIVKDFGEAYADGVVAAMKGAVGCVWCQGLAQPGSKDMERLLAIEYPKAFLDTWASRFGEQTPLNFVYLGGGFTVMDQQSKPWFMAEYRKMRGLNEATLLADSYTHPSITSFVARPAFVLSNRPVHTWAVPGLTIDVLDLAAAMVDAGVAGGEPRRMENADLRKRGKEVRARDAGVKVVG